MNRSNRGFTLVELSDDGRPQQGKVMAVFWDTCTTATSATDLNGVYDLSLATIQCAMVFPKSY